jgi:hypothetical protein
MNAIFFQAAAAVCLISAIHHIHRGKTELHPSWQKLSASGRRAAMTSWNYMTVSYALTS